MENLKLTRIDFRLIHGQVMTRWVKQHDVKSIVVIDNNSAKNPLLKRILLGVAPAGVDVLVYTIEQAVEKWTNNEMPKNNYIILLKDVNSTSKAWEKGLNLKRVQIGGVEGAGNKKNIFKNVVMSKEEVETMKVLYDAGVDVYFQILPEDPEVPFTEALKKF